MLARSPSASPAPPADSRLIGQHQRNGFVILEDHLDAAARDALSTELDPHFAAAAFGTGPFFGAETKRFGRVLGRTKTAARLVLDRTIETLAEAIQFPQSESIQLNLTQWIEIHPGAPPQVPHRDRVMWPINAKFELMINVMWALDEFTAENGAPRVWPGSNHRSEPQLPEEQAIAAEMPAGSACVFLGTTMHSGGANRSTR